jgi:ABC-type glycerol-3-phosphate transport system substrate-binding protein
MGGSQEIDIANVGVSLPPGPPFVGGSNLIVWKHIAPENLEAALHLIAQLTSLKAQSDLCKETGLLPVREALFERPPYTTDKNYTVFKRALAEGRHLPRIMLWGPLEISLVQTFGLIWESIKNRGFTGIEATIRRHLEPLAKRFDRTLEVF